MGSQPFLALDHSLSGPAYYYDLIIKANTES